MAFRAFVPSWLVVGWLFVAAQPGYPPDTFATFDELMAHTVTLKPELVGTHPRVFVTKTELDALRERARTTHRADWARATRDLVALKKAPPPVPGPQERRSQNDVAFAIAGASLAYAIDNKPEYLTAAKACADR